MTTNVPNSNKPQDFKLPAIIEPTQRLSQINISLGREAIKTIKQTDRVIKTPLTSLKTEIKYRADEEVRQQFALIRDKMKYQIMRGELKNLAILLPKSFSPSQEMYKYYESLVKEGESEVKFAKDLSKLVTILQNNIHAYKKIERSKFINKTEVDEIYNKVIHGLENALQSPCYLHLKDTDHPCITFIQDICYNLYVHENENQMAARGFKNYIAEIEKLALTYGAPPESYGKGTLAQLIEKMETSYVQKKPINFSDIAQYIELMNDFCGSCGYHRDSSWGSMLYMIGNPLYTSKTWQAEGKLSGEYDPLKSFNPIVRWLDIRVSETHSNPNEVSEGKESYHISHLLGGTPTSGSSISPIFYGYLDALKKKDTHHLEINLQHQWKEEGARSLSIIKVNEDEEYNSTVTVNSDTVDGQTFEQGNELLTDGKYDPDLFHERFKEYFFNKIDQYEIGGTGYHVAKSTEEKRIIQLQSALEVTRELMREINSDLDDARKARMHQYLFQAIKNIGEMTLSSRRHERLVFRERCRDDIDRGACKNVMSTLLLSLLENPSSSFSMQELHHLLFPVLGRAELVANRSILKYRLAPLLDVLHNVPALAVQKALKTHLKDVGCDGMVFEVMLAEKHPGLFGKSLKELNSAQRVRENLAEYNLPKVLQEIVLKKDKDFKIDPVALQNELQKPRGKFSSHTLIELLKQDPHMTIFFEGFAGVKEGYTIEQHSKMVIDTLEDLVDDAALSLNNQTLLSRADMRLFLALHDIGKSTAENTTIWGIGRKHKELLYNTVILEKVLYKLGYSTEKVNIMKSMFAYDTIGKYLRDEISVNEAEKQIVHMSLQAGLSPEAFLKTMEAYFLADAGSYPALRRAIFTISNNSIDHASFNKLKMETLYRYLKTSRNTHPLKSPALSAEPFIQKLTGIEKEMMFINQQPLATLASRMQFLLELKEKQVLNQNEVDRIDSTLKLIKNNITDRLERILNLEKALQREENFAPHNLKNLLEAYALLEELDKSTHLSQLFSQAAATLTPDALTMTLSEMIDLYQKKNLSLSPLAIRGAIDLLHESINIQVRVWDNKALTPIEKERQEIIHRVEKLVQWNLLLDDSLRNQEIQTTQGHIYKKMSDLFINEGKTDEAWAILIRACTQIILPADHPFQNMDALLSSSDKIRFMRMGTSSTRRRALRLSHKEIDGASYYELELELPKGVRQQLNKNIDLINKQKHLVSISIVDAICPRKDFATGNYSSANGVQLGKDLHIDFKDKGSIFIGNDESMWNEYHRLRLRVDPSTSPQTLHQMLSLLGLPTALLPSRTEDVQKETWLRLVHARHPEAALIYNPEDVLRFANQLPVEEHETLKKDLEMAKQKEVAPGIIENVFKHRAEELWRKGGRGFGCFINGGNLEQTAQVMSKICQSGALSSMERFNRGIIGSGCCPEYNVQHGSANQVFMRLLSKSAFNKEFQIHNFAVEGNVFLLFDVSAAERLPYSYGRDRGGCRNPHFNKTVFRVQKEMPELFFEGDKKILERQDLQKMTVQQEKKISRTTETMFENILGPNYLYGAIVATELEKTILLKTLHTQGTHALRGKPIEEVIFVSDKLHPRMVYNPFEDQIHGGTDDLTYF